MTSDPAEPNALATPAVPMYTPMRQRPIENSSNVTMAPIPRSLQATRTRGITVGGRDDLQLALKLPPVSGRNWPKT